MYACKPCDAFALGSGISRQTKLSTVSCCASPRRETSSKETNYYKILSLESENVGYEEIKKAYRSMALRYHPDAVPPSKRDESTRVLVELNRAYQTLSNPELRRKYDSELRLGESEKCSVRPELSREVWELQLHELAKRSERRQRAKARFQRS